VGFLRSGRLQVEGPPQELRARLTGRILELQGSPLPLLRQVAQEMAREEGVGIEDVQMFGDRLHLRVQGNQADEVMAQLSARINASGGEINRLRAILPQLEDLFISLLETKDESRA
jgi:ABC-2 type transport system ATP-binding protein